MVNQIVGVRNVSNRTIGRNLLLSQGTQMSLGIVFSVINVIHPANEENQFFVQERVRIDIKIKSKKLN